MRPGKHSSTTGLWIIKSWVNGKESNLPTVVNTIVTNQNALANSFHEARIWAYWSSEAAFRVRWIISEACISDMLYLEVRFFITFLTFIFPSPFPSLGLYSTVWKNRAQSIIYVWRTKKRINVFLGLAIPLCSVRSHRLTKHEHHYQGGCIEVTLVYWNIGVSKYFLQENWPSFTSSAELVMFHNTVNGSFWVFSHDFSSNKLIF